MRSREDADRRKRPCETSECAKAPTPNPLSETQTNLFKSHIFQQKIPSSRTQQVGVLQRPLHSPPQQSRDAAEPKGPRASTSFRQHIFSLHSLPLLSLCQHTAPMDLRARTAWIAGAGFLLAHRKMRWRPGDTCLSNVSCELCPRASALSIFLGA